MEQRLAADLLVARSVSYRRIEQGGLGQLIDRQRPVCRMVHMSPPSAPYWLAWQRTRRGVSCSQGPLALKAVYVVNWRRTGDESDDSCGHPSQRAEIMQSDNRLRQPKARAAAQQRSHGLWQPSRPPQAQRRRWMTGSPRNVDGVADATQHAILMRLDEAARPSMFHLRRAADGEVAVARRNSATCLKEFNGGNRARPYVPRWR